MKRTILSFSSTLAVLAAFACSGPAGMAPSGGLMYEVPGTNSVTYVTESSQDISIDAGAMGSMSMSANSEATVAMSFSPGPDGVQVTASFVEVDASMSQPMGGNMTASESDIEGDLVFTLDRRGRGTIVSEPEVKGAAGQLVSPASFVYEFFPRLPGSAVNPGDSWIDTIQYEVSTDAGDVSSSSVLTYTLVGDTVVDGTSLLHISYEGEAEMVGSGMTEGAEVIQTFSGATRGSFLWDPARSLMISAESSNDMDGTVEVPAAGMPPMPMTVVGSGTVRMQGM